jgi:hypothetical protein
VSGSVQTMPFGRPFQFSGSHQLHRLVECQARHLITVSPSGSS